MGNSWRRLGVCWLAFCAFAWTDAALAQGGSGLPMQGPIRTVVAALPGAPSNTNVTYIVTDGASGGDCTTGSGTFNVHCAWHVSGAEYRALGDGGGVGVVTGPGSATDEAIARYDLATGKLLQDSGVTLDDSDLMTFPADGGIDILAGTTPTALFARETAAAGGHKVYLEAPDSIPNDITCKFNDTDGTIPLSCIEGGGGPSALHEFVMQSAGSVPEPAIGEIALYLNAIDYLPYYRYNGDTGQHVEVLTNESAGSTLSGAAWDFTTGIRLNSSSGLPTSDRLVTLRNNDPIGGAGLQWQGADSIDYYAVKVPYSAADPVAGQTLKYNGSSLEYVDQTRVTFHWHHPSTATYNANDGSDCKLIPQDITVSAVGGYIASGSGTQVNILNRTTASSGGTDVLSADLLITTTGIVSVSMNDDSGSQHQWYCLEVAVVGSDVPFGATLYGTVD